MKNFFALIFVFTATISTHALAKSDISATELTIVTQYFENRFPSVKGPDSQIPVTLGSLGFNSLIQELASQGLPTPKAPSTVDWTLNQMGCMRTYNDGGGHQSINYTPRCIARALSYAAVLDSRIKD